MNRLRSLLVPLSAGTGLLAATVLLPSGAAGAATTVPASATATATAQATALDGGETTVLVAPSAAAALVGHGILPVPVFPGRERLVDRGGFTVSATFPVTGGSLNLSSLAGTVRHSGGLDFVDFATNRSLVIEDFDIVLGSTPVLTAFIPALHARATVFDLDLTGAQVSAKGDLVKASGILVSLDAGAAKALDGALHTTLFTGGLTIGTASTLLVTR